MPHIRSYPVVAVTLPAHSAIRLTETKTEITRLACLQCPTTGKPACQMNCNLPITDPLLFNVAADPAEAYPISGVVSVGNNNNNVSIGKGSAPLPGGFVDPEEVRKVVAIFVAERALEVASFPRPVLVAPPDLAGEGPERYGVCCNRDPYEARSRLGNATCDCDGPPSNQRSN